MISDSSTASGLLVAAYGEKQVNRPRLVDTLLIYNTRCASIVQNRRKIPGSKVDQGATRSVVRHELLRGLS
jgi:hypothetical protein